MNSFADKDRTEKIRIDMLTTGTQKQLKEIRFYAGKQILFFKKNYLEDLITEKLPFS
jgi:hypothetical protein